MVLLKSILVIVASMCLGGGRCANNYYTAPAFAAYVSIQTTNAFLRAALIRITWALRAAN